jgi:3-hydroxyisobutyrate dehydrogenase
MTKSITMKLTFLGLGVMGYPMAGYLQKAGHDVCVYNRTTSKAQQWVQEYGGRYAQTPQQAAHNAQAVMICVGNDDDVREMVSGEQGVLSVLDKGALIIDHTTTSDVLAQELFAAAQKKEVHFFDAPVSGGQAGAENGQLSIMVGGHSEYYHAAATAMNSYAKSTLYIGESGAGQTTKMANQILVAGVLQGMSEAFALVNKAGLSLDKVIEATGAGAASSWQLVNRGENISNDLFDYGFAIDLMRKDLGICLNTAKKHDLKLPNTEWVDQCYAQLQDKGYNRSDTSVLVKQYDEQA